MVGTLCCLLFGIGVAYELILGFLHVIHSYLLEDWFKFGYAGMLHCNLIIGFLRKFLSDPLEDWFKFLYAKVGSFRPCYWFALCGFVHMEDRIVS